MPPSLKTSPVGRVEAPANIRLADPLLQADQVLVGEPEPPAHRLAPGQVEYLAHGHPRGGEVEHLGEDTHHGVGLAEGAVGQSDLELARAVTVTALLVVRAERRLNERGEVLDVRAHHDDVAWFESRGLPPAGARWRRAAPRPAGRARDRSAPGCCRRRLESSGRASPSAPTGGRAVGPNVVLDPPQQGELARALLDRHRRRQRRVSAPPSTSCISRASRPHEASSGFARGRPSDPPDVASAWTTHRPGRQPLPQRGRRVEQEEMDVAPVADRRPERRGSWRATASARTRRLGREVQELGSSRSWRAGALEVLGRARPCRCARRAGATARPARRFVGLC